MSGSKASASPTPSGAYMTPLIMIGVERKLLEMRKPGGRSEATAGSSCGRRHATRSDDTLALLIRSSGEYFFAPLSPE